MGAVVRAVVVAATLGSGLTAGTFYAFSSFVMAGLSELPPAQGIAAMQAINRTALRPSLMVPLFGTALVHLGLAVWAIVNWGDATARWVLAGAVLYVLGTIVVTIARNVPKNEALVRLDPADPSAGGQWTRYIASWSAWNHLRTAAALGAAALLIVALIQT